MDQIIDTLLRMLEKDVVDNSKSCAEYFEFFKNYASSVSTICVVHVYMYLNVCGHCPITSSLTSAQRHTFFTAFRLQTFDSKGCFRNLHGVFAWTLKVLLQTGMATMS